MKNPKRGILAIIVAFSGGACATGTGPELPPGEAPTFFLNGTDSLHYAIDFPDTTVGGRFPAFVMVNGSGKQTKTWNTNVTNQMVSRGFIAMRYDKRGTGFSSGDFVSVSTGNSEARLPLLASDVAAAIAELKKNPLVDPTRIGLVGVSQAGWIIPRTVTLSQDVSFTILLVGPTVSIGIENAYSNAAENESRTFAELSDILNGFNGSPGFDPRSDIEGQTVPGLWLFGAADRSIPTAESVAILEDITSSGTKPFSWVVYPDVGHCLQLCGAMVWPDIDDWMADHGIM